MATKADNRAARVAAETVRTALRGSVAKTFPSRVRVSQNDPDACYAFDFKLDGEAFYVEVTKSVLVDE